MTEDLIVRAEQHDYQGLFIHDLNWSRPDHKPVTTEIDGKLVTATNVSSYRGIRVWVVNDALDSRAEAVVDQAIAKTTTDRIVIFFQDAIQVWRWPVRRAAGATSTTTRLSRHVHRAGTNNPRFAAKLAAIKLPAETNLDANAVLVIVRSAFDVEAQNETRHASKLMARLYTAMEKAYPDHFDQLSRNHQISVTLARLLFLLFGDDTDMWPRARFQTFILDYTRTDGSDTGLQLQALFKYLNTAPAGLTDSDPKYDGFRYINGGIFAEDFPLPVLAAEFRQILLEASERDWTQISPAIFGSMFQSVRDAQTRRELGEHYTSEENILKTLNPLFLDDLRAELAHIFTLASREASRLQQFREKLGRIKFLDPACGCGNFIIVAYRELRDLELQVLERLYQITSQPAIVANFGLQVRLTNFFGIEIDEWPARIAETAMFLTDRQCDLKLTERLGDAPDRLPLREQATITVANALRLDWSKLCKASAEVVVAGNPPFAGQKEVGKDPNKVIDMKLAWGQQHHGYMDYVTAWYKKTADYYGEVPGRFAFVSTSSICQGLPVAPTWEPLAVSGWRIFFAHRPFNWKSEATGAAGVHVVIVGMARVDDSRATTALFTYPPSGNGSAVRSAPRKINSYLVDLDDCWVHATRTPVAAALPRLTEGSKLWDFGHLVLDAAQREVALRDPIARKFVRPLLSNASLLKGKKRWVLWLKDSTATERESSEFIASRLALVAQARQDSADSEANKKAATPHLFTNYRQPTSAYIAIPKVTGHARQYLPTAYAQADAVANNTVFTGDDPDGLIFSVVSSRLFTVWQRLIGGHTRADSNFSNTLVWNNFPMPDSVTSTDRDLAVAAGREVLRVREQLQEPLETLYSGERIANDNLRQAHLNLDAATLKLFGMHVVNPGVPDQERLLLQHFAGRVSR